MSICCNVKEHLQVKRSEEDAACVTGASLALETMQGQLAALASLLLLEDGARIYELRLTADGKEYRCEGKTITPEFKAILDVLPDALDVDLEADYFYTLHGDWGMYDLVGPLPMMRVLKDPENDESDWDGVFYSAWYKEDCEEGNGILVAYGKKNGRNYRGQVPWKSVASLPKGCWEVQNSPLYASGDPKDAEYVRACKELSAFFQEEPDLDMDTGEYYLVPIVLHNDEEARRFMELLTTLKRRSDEFGFYGTFADCTQPDARLLRIDDVDEGFLFLLTQV